MIIPTFIPIEIVSKIYMYAHPILNKYIQRSIINYNFVYKTNKNTIYCYKCSRNHRYPKHFSC